MRAFALAVTVYVMAGSMAPAFAQAPLSVPYLPQTEALCGGAAAAMVMRFWGARGVYADAFAPLVDKSAGGIHTSSLNAALEARGWRTQAGGGDLPRLSREVAQGRPVIALIEDRPGRFHYVVVVAATANGPIVVHDPARAPSRSVDLQTFERKWSKSDRWMMILLPGTTTAESHPEPAIGTAAPATAPSACASHVDEAVAAANRNERAAARRILEDATTACPQDAAPWRELAGLDALDEKWASSAGYARRAVGRDPHDDYAWRLLGTAEYLQQHDLAALAVWNRLDEPRVDLIDIKGLSHTRYMVAASAIGVSPQAMLTPGALRIAQRRLREIPAVSTAHVTFHPLGGGQAQVDATVVERERAPMSYPALLTIGVGAAANAELAASFANVSGGGDALDVAWRWWEHRPRVAASYAAPGPLGIWRLEAARETQTFGTEAFEETRTRVAGDLSNWLDQRVRASAGLAVDRWRGLGRTTGVSGRLQFWPVIERVAVETGITGWGGAGARFSSGDARLKIRSRAALSGTVLLGELGYQRASRSAPASLWPGADSGRARDVLLRAHPLLDEGIIKGGVFGRSIRFGSIEAQHWLPPLAQGLARIAPAVFLDTARASLGLPTSDPRAHYDAGAGIRVAMPGTGILRIDVARGLRDGRTALSFGWQR